MKVVYIAAPLSAPTQEEMDRNREVALAWFFYAAECGYAPVASWIQLSAHWPETPENRARGLAIDVAIVRKCDEIWLCGGRISQGMRIETEAAGAHARVRDMTSLGVMPPKRHMPSIDLAGVV